MPPRVSKIPLVIKANLATELGIFNGTLCTLSRVICHPDEQNMHDLDTKQPGESVFLTHFPKLIIVKIPPVVKIIDKEKKSRHMEIQTAQRPRTRRIPHFPLIPLTGTVT